MIPRKVFQPLWASTRRSFATSAQKRKWKRQQKDLRKPKHVAATEEESSSPGHWRPLFFLGVWPLFMSIVVVLNRDDLREEVNEKGMGRFVEDYKRWRRATPAPKLEKDDQNEYDQLLQQLQEQKGMSISEKSDS